MMRYSVRPGDWIFVKGYGFLSFAKSMGKNSGKNKSKILSGKCSQKPLDHAKLVQKEQFKKQQEQLVTKLLIEWQSFKKFPTAKFRNNWAW